MGELMISPENCRWREGNKQCWQKVLHEFVLQKRENRLSSVQQMTKAGEVDTTNETQAENTQHKEQAWSVKQSVTKAGVISICSIKYTLLFLWKLNVVLPIMYSYSVIAQNVSKGSTTKFCMVLYSLGPYFSQVTIRAIVQELSNFTVHFDEAQVKKQVHLAVWYWSEVDQGVKVKYLISIRFGHTTTESVVKGFMINVLLVQWVINNSCSINW